MFILETINVPCILTEPKPFENGEQHEHTKTRVNEAWSKANRLYKNYILNDISNELFDVYCHHMHAKDIWNVLSKKYLFNDEISKKNML